MVSDRLPLPDPSMTVLFGGGWIQTEGVYGPGVMVPPIGRTSGSGMVIVLGVVPSVMTAETAIALGHRLIEAGIGARP